MKKDMKLFHKIYPLFGGLTGDLIFYIAINTVFMTTIKGLTVAEYASLATISSFICLVLGSFIYKIMKRIGTRKSLQVGSFLMLLSSIMLAFGTHYPTFILAITFVEIGFIFNSMDCVMLKHNLLYEKKEEQYVQMKSKVSFIYAFTSAFVALISGPLFSYHHYLPMYLQIVLMFICFILSFFLFDIGEGEPLQKEIPINREINMNRLLLMIFISYGILYGSVNILQGDIKLLMQEVMLPSFGLEKMMYVLGIVVFISRIVRMVGIMLFQKFVQFFDDRIILLLSIIAFSVPIFIVISYFLPISILWKILIMSISFFILLAIREPFNIYMQDLALKQCALEEQSKVAFHLIYARKIGATIFSVIISLLLIKLPLITVFYFTTVAYFINFLFDFKILKEIRY